MSSNLPSRIRSDLLAGFLVVVPVGITFWVFFALVDLADGLIRALPAILQPETHLGFPIPGLGVVVTMVLVGLVGVETARHHARLGHGVDPIHEASVSVGGRDLHCYCNLPQHTRSHGDG